MKDDIFWVRVYHEKDFEVLKKELQSLRHYNSWTDSHRDKKGNPISIIGYDYKPDSDWGKTKNSMGVWFANDELCKVGMELIEANAHEARPSVL